MTSATSAAASRRVRGSVQPRRARLDRALLAGLVLLAWAASCVTATRPADIAEPPLERSVKAAFLYKFLGYVEWPATAFPAADTPIIIGVIGADEMAAELQQIIAGRSVGDRPVIARRMREGESLAGLNVLFVARADAVRLAQVAKAAQQRSILLVTEFEGALDRGSIINFVVNEGHVRFEVSLAAAERTGLKLSSRMLAVAQYVRTGG